MAIRTAFKHHLNQRTKGGWELIYMGYKASFFRLAGRDFLKCLASKSESIKCVFVDVSTAVV